MVVSGLLGCILSLNSAGCGRGGVPDAVSSTEAAVAAPALFLPAATPMVGLNATLNITLSDASGKPVDPASCAWQTGDATILSSLGKGSVRGVAVGSTSITVTCGGLSATGSALVTRPGLASAIVITHGGSFTGTWRSDDPNTPAVLVQTTEPVAILNSTIKGKNDLIRSVGVEGGAHLTIQNVSGVGLAPGVAGQARGIFVHSQAAASLVVEHCTFTGVSFGVYADASVFVKLSIQQNVATNLDDRLDNGSGGTTPDQRIRGHLVQLNGDSAPNGAEIAWNQIRNTTGLASIEDILSITRSQGTTTAPIHIHDNYLEGAFATGQTTGFTGSGMQMDGEAGTGADATAFVLIEHNVVVRTANVGIAIGTGHDITVVGNRVVSCGQDGAGNWINPGGTAYVLWNYYQVPNYLNNTIAQNSGDLVYANQGKPADSYLYDPPASIAPNNVVGPNQFDQSCWVNGVVSQAAEQAEWTAWQQRVAQAGYELGDTH